jgi:hypothetical protein
MLPNKPGQDVEESAKDIEIAMTWCRNNNIGVDDEDHPPENFKKLARIPMPDGRTPEQKTKDVEKISNWKNRKRQHSRRLTRCCQVDPANLL